MAHMACIAPTVSADAINGSGLAGSLCCAESQIPPVSVIAAANRIVGFMPWRYFTDGCVADCSDLANCLAIVVGRSLASNAYAFIAVACIGRLQHRAKAQRL